jgi:hypothetical protein
MRDRRAELEALVAAELDARLAAEDMHDGEHRITSIAAALGLDATELQTILGLSAQSGAKGWRTSGWSSLLASSRPRTLWPELRPGRLPNVLERPAPAYDGESMLDMLRAGRHAELQARVTESLDFASGA